VQLYSTGGTQKFIEDLGVPVTAAYWSRLLTTSTSRKF
jgi:hypothetical protein